MSLVFAVLSSFFRLPFSSPLVSIVHHSQQESLFFSFAFSYPAFDFAFNFFFSFDAFLFSFSLFSCANG
eukprot:m.235931 g.235931  ORF g.235931 m.235931 type:complete len:69 (-) comp20345_c0_seq1:59-265(-)